MRKGHSSIFLTDTFENTLSIFLRSTPGVSLSKNLSMSLS
jgi:hypothetical protein